MAISRSLSRSHSTTSGSGVGFVSSDSVLGIYNQATAGIFAVLVGVVALSLVVGGIVIMNIMLMVVTERAKSLDFRRGSRLLEVLAMLHLLTPLYLNAHQHREDSRVLIDVDLQTADDEALFEVTGFLPQDGAADVSR